MFRTWPNGIQKKTQAAAHRKLGCEYLESRRLLTTFNVPADGTIDDVVAAANADVAGAPHIIELNADANAITELLLTNSTTINGNGNTLTGSGASRVFHFADNDPAVTTVNAINDLTITGGDSTATAGPFGSFAGGGIRSTEELTISNSIVTANAARVGGGISNSGGTMTLDGVTISNNTAAELAVSGYSSTGGGVFNVGELTITGSMITQNNATHDDFDDFGSFGGGLASVGTLAIADTTISGNTAELGGGVYLGADSVTTFASVDIDGNGAPVAGTGSEPRGGGLYISGNRPTDGSPVQYARLAMVGGSISNNSVAGDDGNLGGGMSAGPDTVIELTDTVVTGNVALESGGGIYATAFSSFANGYVARTRLTLNNVDISGNSIPYSYNATGGSVFPYGGGLMAGRGAVVAMNGGSVSDNVSGDSIANRGNARGVGVMSDSFSFGNPNATNEVTLDGVNISGNFANDRNAFGSGVAAAQYGNLLIRNSTITGNTAGGAGNGVGGGVGLFYGAVTIEDSYIAGNEAGSDGGGVIASVGSIGIYTNTLDITRSTIANNVSGFDGGGISAYSTVLRLLNTTLSGNESLNEGGAIWQARGATGSTVIDFSTITGNTGNTGGGAAYGAALYLFEAGNTLSNSIVSGNAGGDVADPSGYTTIAYSLISETSNSPYLVDGINGNIVGASAVLGPLAPAGGNGVPVHELVFYSPGINVADPAATEALDGRRVRRLTSDGRNMGAFERMGGDNGCDFDGDDDCDGDDIDAFQAEATGAASDLSFDLDGDGDVDIDDRNEWLLTAGLFNLGGTTGYLLGDINLDGSVDVSDFNQWNANKFTTNSAWTIGDVTMDGFVDVSDFGAWNNNKFTASSIIAPNATPHTAGEIAQGASNGGSSAALRSGDVRELAASKGITDLEFKKDGAALHARASIAELSLIRGELAHSHPNVDPQLAVFAVAEIEESDAAQFENAESKQSEEPVANFTLQIKSTVDNRTRVQSANRVIEAIFADADSIGL